MSNIAIFPGSFDPFTRGHQDIVSRGSDLFDKVIIAIGDNSAKKRYFKTEKMVSALNTLYADNPKVEIQVYKGLTAHFATEAGARFILRGLRNTTDFEYENTIAQANKSLNPNLETYFIITDPKLAHISSTITRDLHKYGGDISDFVPYSL